MHMQGRDVVVVQHEAGVEAVAGTEVEAGKHYWDLHIHTAGVGRIRIRRVVRGAGWCRTS